ncbi:YoaK family protein [Streptomyces cinnamoneus]|uniref:Membrane protein n=1 Tax=Streptomyces cinnamoneus TaxID=53446 RepID=A0A918TSG4_STRCJ|nr:YoaK family protein [Streptomyces cinnamoneus]GHC57242.1 membrane protein [Streptomyces cinnamoneus]
MDPRPGAALTAVMVALTLITGVVEAVSFLVLGPVFTAMQSGNVLFLAFSLTKEGGLSPVAASASLGGFAVGAVLGSRLESSVDVHGRRWLVVALVAEAALLGVGALTAWGIDGVGEPLSGRHYAVTAVVAGAMGMRNVTTMRARVPDLPTTLATRSMTALLGGSPLALDTRITSGARAQGRRTAAVAVLFAGGLLGAWMLHEAVRPPVVLLTAAGGVLATGLLYACAPRAGRPEPA